MTPSASNSLGFEAPSVVIAEPRADTRLLYGQAFGVAGWRCLEAADGREALVQALTKHPTLCVAELSLPLIDGIALCRELRADAEVQSLPILIVTADARPERIVAASRAGANAVLVKPAPIDTIVSTAATLVEEFRALRAASAAVQQYAVDIRAQSVEERARAAALRSQSSALISRSRRNGMRRFSTATPGEPPPVLLCSDCGKVLVHQVTHVGGVNPRLAERWDELACTAGCGARYEYRFRTRRLRRIQSR